MTSPSISAIAYQNFGLNPTMLYTMLMLTVIIGGMRTTRHAALASLRLLCYSEVVGKVWTYSPHHALLAAVKMTLPPCVCRLVRALLKASMVMVLGKAALKKTNSRHKHSLKNRASDSTRTCRRLNTTVSGSTCSFGLRLRLG